MDLNVGAIRKSFAAIAARAGEVSRLFYEKLFKRYPELKPLFDRADIEDQRKKLIRSLAIVVASLDKPEQLSDYLEGLGRMHKAYGAQPAHYEAFGGVLLEALAEIAGPALWDEELKQAWAEAYDVISGFMLEGARQSSRGAESEAA